MCWMALLKLTPLHLRFQPWRHQAGEIFSLSTAIRDTPARSLPSDDTEAGAIVHPCLHGSSMCKEGLEGHSVSRTLGKVP